MERESNPMQPMCRSGCGFYGNPATDGLCSVCYKDSLRKKQQPPVGSTPVSVPSPQPSPTFSPAITIPSAAQPTVQSLQQQHSEIKEQPQSLGTASRPSSTNFLRHTAFRPATNRTTTTITSNGDAGKPFSAVPRQSHYMRAGFSCYREADGSFPPTSQAAFDTSERLPLRPKKREEESREEGAPSKSVSFRLNKFKRVGFLKETTDISKRFTNYENTFLSGNQEPLSNLSPLRHSPIQASRVTKPIGRRYSKSSIAVNAAKILTTPQKGQAAASRIFLTDIREKKKNYTKELKRNWEREIKDRSGQTAVTADVAQETRGASNDNAPYKGPTISRSVENTTDLKEPTPETANTTALPIETDKYNFLGKLAFKAKLAKTEKAELNSSNLKTDKKKSSIIRLPDKPTAPTLQSEDHELEISKTTKGAVKSILSKPPIVSAKQNLVKSGRGSQISTTRRSPPAKISRTISNSRIFPNLKGTKPRPGTHQLPLKAVTPISVPANLIPKFTTNLNAYNLHTKPPKDSTHNVTPSQSFLQQTRPRFHLPYVDMEKKDSQSDQDANDRKSRSSSTSSRKRKINEENTAKTSSDAAASASASAGPSTSTQPAEEDDKDKEDDKDAKKKKNRCTECRKKVGLTGFLCRCGGLYCAVHRYSDKHNCTFDYREHGAQEIRRNNPVVVGEKIQKI